MITATAAINQSPIHAASDFNLVMDIIVSR